MIELLVNRIKQWYSSRSIGSSDSTSNVTKSNADYGDASFLSWYSAASRGGSDLQAFMALQLAATTSIVSTAIDLITSEFSTIKLQLKHRGTGEIKVTHPVLTLLDSPNPAVSGALFRIELAAFYLITGNTYLVASGDFRRPPLELFNVFPQQVIAQQDSRDGFTGSYLVTTDKRSMTFDRREVNRKFRYFDGAKLEFKQIRRFTSQQGSLYGISPLDAIYPEIEQFNQSSTHNISLLRRGARPSGVLMFGQSDGSSEALTDDQYTRLKAQFNAMYIGAQNAGGVIIAEGSGGVHYQDMMTNNRDMDFLKLRENVENKIYTRLGIPLPLVIPGRQTFNNMIESKEQLYDNTVLPVADIILDELTAFLMPRYVDGENWFITYNESDIPALRARRSRELAISARLGIYSINELRTKDGAEAIGEEGNTIWAPSNIRPVGEDNFTGDQVKPPAKISATVPKDTKQLID